MQLRCWQLACLFYQEDLPVSTLSGNPSPFKGEGCTIQHQTWLLNRSQMSSWTSASFQPLSSMNSLKLYARHSNTCGKMPDQDRTGMIRKVWEIHFWPKREAKPKFPQTSPTRSGIAPRCSKPLSTRKLSLYPIAKVTSKLLVSCTLSPSGLSLMEVSIGLCVESEWRPSGNVCSGDWSAATFAKLFVSFDHFKKN